MKFLLGVQLHMVAAEKYQFRSVWEWQNHREKIEVQVEVNTSRIYGLKGGWATTTVEDHMMRLKSLGSNSVLALELNQHSAVSPT